MSRKTNWRLPKATATPFRAGDLDLLDRHVIAGTQDRQTTVEFVVVSSGDENPVMAGTAETLDAVTTASITSREEKLLEDTLQPDTLALLTGFQFRGTLSGYQDGDRLPEHSPAATLTGRLSEAILLSPVIASTLTASIREATGVKLLADERNRYWGGAKLVISGHPRNPSVIGGAEAFTSPGDASSSTLDPTFVRNLPHLPVNADSWEGLTPATSEALAEIEANPELASSTVLQILGDSKGTTRSALDAISTWASANKLDLRIAVEVDDLDRLLRLRPKNKNRARSKIGQRITVTQLHVRNIPALSVKVMPLVVAVEDDANNIVSYPNQLDDGTIYPGGIKTVYRECDESWQPSVEHLVTEATPLVHPDWETQQLPYLMRGKVLFTPDLEDATERASTVDYKAPPLVLVDGEPLAFEKEDDDPIAEGEDMP